MSYHTINIRMIKMTKCNGIYKENVPLIKKRNTHFEIMVILAI